MKNLLLKIKRKLFFYDELTLSLVFKDDYVNDIPFIYRLAEIMLARQIKYIRRDPETKRLILKTKEGIYLATDNFFLAFDDVFGQRIYGIDDKYFAQPFIVFDFGMNRAYTSLFFLQYEKCIKVFGFEPDPKTFEFAKYNINLNTHLKSKIETFNHGLGNDNCFCNFYKFKGTDISSCLYLDKTTKKMDKKYITQSQVEIKNVSEVVNSILKRNEDKIKDTKIILKIDVEGAEYEIFENLCNSGVINKFDLILGECHDGFNQSLEKIKDTHNLVHLTETPIRRSFIFEKEKNW